MTDAAPPAPDAAAARRLAEQGLRLESVDPADETRLRPWLDVVERAFLNSSTTDERYAEVAPDFAGNSTFGVYEGDDAERGEPVATITGWTSPLSLPGGRSIDAWAVSDVAVAPTHRRRGIGRAVLEGDLRRAAEAGLALAMLTASEATIYPRFGYGPAAQIADLAIDTRRAGWAGGTAPGRLSTVTRDGALAAAPTLFERARLRRPGRIALTGHLLSRLFGVTAEPDRLRDYRYVRYDDPAGDAQGLLAYTVTEHPEDFAESTLHVAQLVGATDDAVRALWRFVLEHDLITRVTTVLRSTDEVLRWLVADPRAIRTTTQRDHLWLRILDPVAALTGRTYETPGRVALEVDDPLGHAAGRFLLEADETGAGHVERIDGQVPDGIAAVALDVGALGALYLGGPSALTLARAGRISAERPGSVAALDALLRSPVVPHLGVWF